jgi:PPK2 family polyphosphate:nucleotide phosphotransferase
MTPKRSSLADRLRIDPGSEVDLATISPDDTHGFEKADEASSAPADLEQLESLQERIWAERKHAILIVLQGIDGAGKDGTIRHVMSAFNPQGCEVTGFDVPTRVEAAHDFLWRIHAATPGLGEVAIFNRSHYESVLVVRVHELAPREVWQARYDEINDFEGMLANEGTMVLKFFLHISRDEQAKRLEALYQDPTKQWKFQPGDLEERKRWDDYLAAYQDVLRRCSTEVAPWYVIPANHKWFRNLAVREILAEHLAALHPEYPRPTDLPKDLKIS